jgi:hypothetical protein
MPPIIRPKWAKGKIMTGQGQIQMDADQNQGAVNPNPQTQEQPQKQPQEQPQQGQTQQQQAQDDIPQEFQNMVVRNEKGELLIPLSAAQDERRKRQELNSKLASIEEQLFLYRMNPVMGGGGEQPQQQSQLQSAGGQPLQGQTQQGTSPADFLSQMDDSEIINAGELKQVLRNLHSASQQGSPKEDAQTMEMVGEQLLMMVKPDAEQVIMGGFRQRIQNEPYLVQFVQNAHPMLRPFMAYRLGQGQSTSQAQAGAQQDLNAQQSSHGSVQQIVTNAQKPTPTAVITGSGALDVANRYASMSDDELEAEIERVKQSG